MAESKILRQQPILITDSLNLDNAIQGIFYVDGENISGTKPYNLQAGTYHLIMMMKKDRLEQEVIIDCYAAKISTRTRKYSGGTWAWESWHTISLSSS